MPASCTARITRRDVFELHSHVARVETDTEMAGDVVFRQVHRGAGVVARDRFRAEQMIAKERDRFGRRFDETGWLRFDGQRDARSGFLT